MVAICPLEVKPKGKNWPKKPGIQVDRRKDRGGYEEGLAG